MAVVVLGGIAAAVLLRPRKPKPIVLEGVVIREASDPRGESPIPGVSVSAAGGLSAGIGRTSSSGLFKLALHPSVKRGQPVTLLFRHADYQPLALPTYVGDQLYVVRMAPAQIEPKTRAIHPSVVVSNVLVRYSVQTPTTTTVGTAAKTFTVANKPNVPCDHRFPCSPDGKWKAAVAAAFLDAGKGNALQDPRVSCIAGPCPFTSTTVDGLSQDGRVAKVTARTWSSSATFLLQAEVVHRGMAGVVQKSYPVIFGRALNFSLPASAEGPTLEASLNGLHIIFPLPPNPSLSWVDCTVSVEKGKTKLYRCELNPKYKF